MPERELLAQTRDLLATLYLDPDMARIVAQDAGLDLRRVEYSNRPLENWEAILEEAQHQGRITALLDVAARQYPEQAELKGVRAAWAAELRPATASAPPAERKQPTGLIGAAAVVVLVVAAFLVLRYGARMFSAAAAPSSVPAVGQGAADTNNGSAVETPTSAPATTAAAAHATLTLRPAPAGAETPVAAATIAASPTSGLVLSEDMLAAAPDVRLIHGATNAVTGTAWSPKGDRLATTDRSGHVCIFDMSREVLDHCFGDDNPWTTYVVWSPDGGGLAGVVNEASEWSVRIWDTASWHLLHTLTGFDAGIHSLNWSPDGHRLVTTAGVGQVSVWDFGGSDLPAHPASERHFDSRMWAAWTPDGRYIVVVTGAGTNNYSVNVWDPAGNRLLTQKLEDAPYLLESLALSPDGSRLAGGSFSPKIKERVRIWDVASGSLVRALDEVNGIIWALAWSPDGHWLAAGSGDSTLRVWDAESGAQDQMLEQSVIDSSLSWSPSGLDLAFGSNDLDLHLWRVK